jgi:ABC-type multidrug transport system ATPase subunit
LLELDGVCVRHRDERDERTTRRDPHDPAHDERGGRQLLREVSLSLNAGELAVVWGMRRSGRSTLLRVAAGIEAPCAGAVRFAGNQLDARRARTLGDGIGYCRKGLAFADGQRALDHAMVGLLSRWVTPARARAQALEQLERVGAAHCARMRARELSAAESVRVALARTLALKPRVLVIDEPVKGVELIDRDGVLALLRTLADDGLAILASTGESTALSEADRAYVLGSGRLRGAPATPAAPAPAGNVVPLRADAARRAHG